MTKPIPIVVYPMSTIRREPTLSISQPSSGPITAPCTLAREKGAESTVRLQPNFRSRATRYIPIPWKLVDAIRVSMKTASPTSHHP